MDKDLEKRRKRKERITMAITYVVIVPLVSILTSILTVWILKH